MLKNVDTNSLSRLEARKAFESAESVDEMLKAFSKMEKLFPESELGTECWTIANILFNHGWSREQVLSFGTRALRILVDNDTKGNLNKLIEDEPVETGRSSCNCVFITYVNTLKSFFHVNKKMGRYEEALSHLKKQSEMQEQVLEEGSIELGDAYKEVAICYLQCMNFEDARPFLLKALDIHVKHYGRNSVVGAIMRNRVAIMYNQVGEYEIALEQNELSRNIMKKRTPRYFEAEVTHGHILIGLGRYKEAIDVLKGTDMEERRRGLAFVWMAKAFCYLEKFADAKKHMKTAQRILEKKGTNPLNVAIGFRDMSTLYEKMNDLVKAISMLQRALSVPQIPPKFVAEGSERLLSLISLSGKEKEKLKENFGPERCEVGYSYMNLGAAYLKSGKEKLAAKFLVKAKAILDAALGPHHLDSLKTSQTLAETYATLRSYDLAMDIQKKVVEGLTELGPSEQEKLDEAVCLLEKVKVAIGAGCENCSANSSKCGAAEDGNVS